MVIVGSVRPVQAGNGIARWVLNRAAERTGSVEYALTDLRTLNLPFYAEETPPMMSNGPTTEEGKAWSQMVSEADGFIFVMPEYNHGYSPALKNAVDYLYSEWKDKPAAFVGYGSAGATRSISQFRDVLEFLGLNLQDDQVGIKDIWEALDADGNVKPDKVTGDLNALFDNLERSLN